MKHRSTKASIESTTDKQPNSDRVPSANEGRGAYGRGHREPRYHTIDGVADIFDVSLRTVRRWIDAGELVAHKINNVVRISDRDLADFSARHRGF